ncbi:MAG: hypothetical protein P1P64_03530 [Treponemataceae bacterium]
MSDFFLVMDKDETGTNPKNKVTGEKVNITQGEVLNLNHSIFFENGFYIYTDLDDKANTLLSRGLDYQFVDEDTIATEISNKNCWKSIKVFLPITSAYVDYQVYGDFVTAGIINSLKAQAENARTRIVEIDNQTQEMQESLARHTNDTAPHEATPEPTANRLVMYTESETIKANSPNPDTKSEVVTVGYLDRITDSIAQTDTHQTESISEIKNELQANKPVLELGDVTDETAPNAEDYATDEEYEEALTAYHTAQLNTHVNKMHAYYNPIRNENGSISVPTAIKGTEAVNKAQLDRAIETLIGTAPETLDTLGEIAEALAHDTDAVNSLITAINEAKAEAKDFATAKANQAETNANGYTNTQLEGYYTQTETDTAINNAKTQAEITAAEKAEVAESNAKEHTNTALENYYNKNETYKKSEVDEKLGKIPTSGGGLIYDFNIETGYETNDTVFIDGKRKPVIRLCIQKENVTNNFYINTKEIGNIEHIMKISGTVTGTNGYILSAENAVSCYVDRDNKILWFVFEKQGVKYNTALIIDFITENIY